MNHRNAKAERTHTHTHRHTHTWSARSIHETTKRKSIKAFVPASEPEQEQTSGAPTATTVGAEWLSYKAAKKQPEISARSARAVGSIVFITAVLLVH